MTRFLRGFTRAERVKNLTERSVTRGAPGSVYKSAAVSQAEVWADEPTMPPEAAARAEAVVTRHFVRQGRLGRLHALRDTQSDLGDEITAGLQRLTTRDG